MITMTGKLILSAILTCAIGTIAPAAQSAGVAADGYVGKKITLDLREVPLVDLLRFLHHEFDVNFIVDRDVGDVRVTVMLREVPWNLALDQILRAHRLGAIREGSETWVVAPGRR